MIIPDMPSVADPHWAHAVVGHAGVLKAWETMAVDQFWKGAISAAVVLLVINAFIEKLRR